MPSCVPFLVFACDDQCARGMVYFKKKFTSLAVFYPVWIAPLPGGLVAVTQV